MKRLWLLGLALLVPLTIVGAADKFSCQFLPGQWDPADFLVVKSSRWPDIGQFVQEKDHLVNACPKDASAEEMLSKRAAETYAALLYKKELSGKHTVSTTMSFDYRMAPSIVIAEKPDLNQELHPEFRTHYELVFYDQGLNIWRHWFVDGKQVWKKVAFLKAKFEPGKKYTMTVEIAPSARGTVLTMTAGDHSFGVLEPDLSKDYYVGIIACEGLNRFYDFKIE